MIPDAARDQIPVLPDQRWTTRYEKLRERGMAKSSSIDHTHEDVVLIRGGLVAWMKAWPQPAQEPTGDSGAGSQAVALTVPSHLLHSAASLLVNMILSLGTPTEVPHERRCHEGFPQPS